ncbi:hypothetical protein OPV22_008849 [Ensete ventricosum]|uniref:Uncharacterized protein n=1 Tax=Ensete ventricosum TaxID=4639 RepID=A0AAV8RD76_ENSVE|nr:hypothetical protein OPV22_008849 [Ensete ventricosum]
MRAEQTRLLGHFNLIKNIIKDPKVLQPLGNAFLVWESRPRSLSRNAASYLALLGALSLGLGFLRGASLHENWAELWCRRSLRLSKNSSLPVSPLSSSLFRCSPGRGWREIGFHFRLLGGCSGEKMRTGSEPGTAETYMMSGVGSIPNMAFVPPPVGIELMGNQLQPEYIFDQGLSYSAADSYGYVCTGYESPSEWGDHHSIFGLDGHDLHYMGLQAENVPYVYYTPGYGYAQSPFNQCTPYVPNPVTGLDGPYVGGQQYLNFPSYRPPISSPAYFPVIVQPSPDFMPNNSIDPAFLGAGAIATGPVKSTPPQASVSAAASSRLAASTTPFVMSAESHASHKNQAAAKPFEGSQINIPPSNQLILQEAMMHGSGTHGYQGVGPDLMRSTYQFSHGRVPSIQNYVKVAAPSNNGLTNRGSNVLGLTGWDEQRRGPQFQGIANDVGRNPDVLAEQNKGPRTNRPKDQLSLSGFESSESIQKSASDAQGGCIIIDPDHYNKDDFPVDYPDARQTKKVPCLPFLFCQRKDTQEIPYRAGIDMLKIFKTSLLKTSILDDFMFYEERQKKMLEDKFRHLGSSYNTYVPAFVSVSGPTDKAEHPSVEDGNQPSGTGKIAQAVGHQTFSESDQSSKYKEKLQDDTNSRPLKVVGEHSGVAVGQSQKTDGKQSSVAISLSTNADGKCLAGTKDPANGVQPNKVVQPPNADTKSIPANHPPKSDGKESSLVMNQLPKAEIEPPSLEVPPRVDGKQSKWKISQPPKSDGNPARAKEDVKGVGKGGPGGEQFKEKTQHASESSADKDTEHGLATDHKGTNIITKAGVPSLGPKLRAAKSPGTMEPEVISPDFVKVGSVPIKVKDLGESSMVMSVGTLPTESKGPKPSKKGTSADSQQPKK